MKRIYLLSLTLFTISMSFNTVILLASSDDQPQMTPPPNLTSPQSSNVTTGTDSGTVTHSMGNMNTTPTGHTGTEGERPFIQPPLDENGNIKK